MSSINMQEVSGVAVPVPANGEVEFFTDLNGEPSVKLPSGQIKTLGAVFGSEFTSKKRIVTDTTNSASFQIYDSLSLTGLPAGNYRIDLKWTWGYASGSNDIRVEWRLDGVQQEEQRQEPKDGGSDQRHLESTFDIVALSGDHTIDIRFASSNGSSQARMYASHIVVYRID